MRTMLNPNRPAKTDFNWPPIAILSLILGLAIAIYIGRSPERGVVADLAEQMRQFFAWRSQPAGVEFGQALIVTASSRDQLTVVTTLSPRGFHPLLAATEKEVQTLIQAYPGTVKLAVVDVELPDYARVARTLRTILPADNIITLKGAHRSEDIALMLLDRLGLLQEVVASPLHTDAAQAPVRGAT